MHNLYTKLHTAVSKCSFALCLSDHINQQLGTNVNQNNLPNYSFMLT